MKKFKVRVEINYNAIELAEIEVLAHTEEDAKQLAILKYEDNPSDVDTWLSDGAESSIRTNGIDDWEVKEVK